MKGFSLRLVETQKKNICTYKKKHMYIQIFFSKLQTHFGSTYYFNKI